MAQAFREKEISFLELVEEIILKINQLNPSLNKVVYKWLRHDFSD